jgi:hypothetical protein
MTKSGIFELTGRNDAPRYRYLGMDWAVPSHPRERVNNAGKLLAGPKPAFFDVEEIYEIINNWRSSHAFPLNTFHTTLKSKAVRIDPRCFTSQRIKRLRAIEEKLTRLSWLSLTQMQDIGGCRAVVSSVRRVYQLAKLYRKGDLKHSLVDQDDYIKKPKKSGYRSYHLIYSYHSDKKDTYNKLKIEVQLRSRLQHGWATAVEVVGQFTKQALKSSQGHEDWLRFFALMGTAIAIRERTEPVPDTPSDPNELRKALQAYEKKLNVIEHLETYSVVFEPPPHIQALKPHYFLLNLNLETHRFRVSAYGRKELERASTAYLDAERSGAGRTDVVLVAVESLRALKRAYPNYYLDTTMFVRAVRRAIAK